MRTKTITLAIFFLFISNCLIISGANNDNQINNTENTTEYDLLIISPKIFINSLKPLVIHKNSHNVKTFIKNVNEIYKESQGRDNAEQVKYYIKNVIEKWNIKYVLLVGGRKSPSLSEKWWIPVRYSHIEWDGHLNWTNQDIGESSFISDLYFADIYDKNGNFSSWDSDNDSVFGEWLINKSADDMIDLKPDVYIGRLPCQTIFEIKTVVNKIIKYESKSYNDSWFKNIVAIGGDSFPELNDSYEGEEYTQMGLNYMTGFNHIKLWTSDSSLKNWRDIVKAINNGCGFVFFSGAANPYLWATNLPNVEKRFYCFRSLHVPFLINHNKLPILINGGGCHNNQFSVSILKTKLHIYPLTQCMGWRLTSKPFGGVIASIAPTSIAHETPTIWSKRGGMEWLDIHFFEEYNINKTDILGAVWGKTINHFLQNFNIDFNDTIVNGDRLIAKNVQAWTIIGDPSLKIGGYQKYVPLM